jgi:hypothetical protein
MYLTASRTCLCVDRTWAGACFLTLQCPKGLLATEQQQQQQQQQHTRTTLAQQSTATSNVLQCLAACIPLTV